MPTCLISSKARKMGKVASPTTKLIPTVFVPIVPITYLFNVVVIRNKRVMGMYKCIYARRSLNHLGTVMGTRRLSCAKN